MLRRVMSGVGVAGATLVVTLALAACGGDPTPNPGGGTGNGGTGDGGTPTGDGSGGGSNATYAIKTDLCTETDFGPLKAVLPSVTKLTPQKLDRELGTLYACDGNAGKSEAYKDIGFITLVAYIYKTKESADTEFEASTNPKFVEDIQSISGLGQRAASFFDGPAVEVDVQDGSFLFTLKWSANNAGDPPAGVREALVAMARSTLPKLKAT
jgi:hypothetical protein